MKITANDYATSMQRVKYSQAEAAQFTETFGVGLSEFWDGMFGFDVIRFDKYIRTPDRKSMRDYITENHGEVAMRLVELLVKR